MNAYSWMSSVLKHEGFEDKMSTALTRGVVILAIALLPQELADTRDDLAVSVLSYINYSICGGNRQ